ncbi:response regulator transcription factor [Paenibacillus mucilaginosus]|uniref:Response regulator n=1 Tax=Paenibacillus mucilaginosus (strain KNP414) TaxID=1036673 RepID=F8FMK7_PAEMK|nr:response regulator transcription factor [Paenibacillus mucilaginosus]AEI40090.1 response regulator [Paenibacillus mucilaginosus KNP414]MCG7215696.1 response regulator transcription factor [Paenibacillus mucilaginosus]WDM29328.1 response regulator transcription factor [Paenibacillus mucilaginosus]
MGRILILEDEDSIRSFVVVNLKRQGHEVTEAVNGDEALAHLLGEPGFDIALLDVMVPGIDGFEVCRRVREVNERIGIIFLTAKVQEQDKVMGLSLGADDHVSKPFSPGELMARIQSLLRRISRTEQQEAEEEDGESPVQSGPFELRRGAMELLKHGERIDLTPTEFSLVSLLLSHDDRVWTRDALLDAVWGADYVGDPKIVDVNIRRLRQKIEDQPSKPVFIETVWGSGYRFNRGEGP